MKDQLIRILTRDGSLRGLAAVTTDLVEECRRRQDADPTATLALGRLATGAALMGGLLKGDQRLNLTVEGNGPLLRMSAETDARGRVRATVKNPHPGVPLREGRLDVVGAVGKAGFLHVSKDLGLREPYRGTVQLVSSEIGEDLAYYLTTSEQIPSAVSLGVYINTDGSVGAAGGFIIQAMPPGDENRIAQLEERLRSLPPVTSLLCEGQDAEAILAHLLADIPYEVKERTPLCFRCTCNRRQILQMLAGLGRSDLEELIAKDEAVQVTCEFCKEVYTLSPTEIRATL
ncbi:Hsp33 family molecular chaperone HslO [Geoalkalibacter halelectricus]|uniref:33 kDa chaperonin n=1 Tax=Geoalkalibacter halelectricus TaxID=2847045 RepID=A0ABY5ZMF1_9BACT|nr:Hsp33 family molecular chaperone HslO [Geoalkalibacter halelectricus]MDO3378402.1 Hsp33 family molecular chaperone HslO [Geoalkalibacter halelectricus]UWZ80278.1 Hsp33 family molecular chaperone HslO [Geoalkalibacter halelectricus]